MNVCLVGDKMKIGRTICVKCGKIEELTLDELIESLKSCKTIEEIKNIVNQARIGKDIELIIVCEKCEVR